MTNDYDSSEIDDSIQEFEHEFKQIRNEFNSDKESLEEQIEHINLIEHKINHLIYDLEAANQHLQTLLQSEKDQNKKKNYHTAIAYNIERLTKLYSVLREYQDTKYKYYSTISDLTFKKNKLLYIDLSKVNETTQSDSYDLFNKLITVMNNPSVNQSQDIKEINDQDEYKV